MEVFGCLQACAVGPAQPEPAPFLGLSAPSPDFSCGALSPPHPRLNFFQQRKKFNKKHRFSGDTRWIDSKFALRTCGPTLWGLLPAVLSHRQWPLTVRAESLVTPSAGEATKRVARPYLGEGLPLRSLVFLVPCYVRMYNTLKSKTRQAWATAAY